MPQNFFEPRTPVSPKGGGPRVAPARTEPPSHEEPPHRDQRPPREEPPHRPPNEPSWLRIYWNTLRSFTRRRLGLAPIAPRAAAPREAAPRASEAAPARTRRRVLLPVALTVVIAAVATAAVLLNTGKDSDSPKTASAAAPKSGAVATSVAAAPTTTAPPETPEPSPEVRGQVAQWIKSHIGAGQVVACDAAVCAELHSAGFPASSVLQVQDSAQDLLGADIAVVTGPLRSRLGADMVDRLTSAQPLAVFGPDDQPATVVSVARSGRDAYTAALAADVAARKFSGAALLKNKRLVFTPAARAALAAGQVDMRLCALLATLSSGHTVSVTGFADPAPGSGPSVPRTGMDIATVDKTLATGPSAQARTLRTLINQQRAPYRPLRVVSVRRSPRTNPVLSVFYAQPAPLAPAS